MNAAPLLKRFPRTACRLSPGCSDFSEPLGKGSDRSLKDKNPQKQTPDGVELLKQFVQGMSHWHRRAALQNNPPRSGSAAPGDPKWGPACPAWPNQAENKAACPLCEQDEGKPPAFSPRPTVDLPASHHHSTRSPPDLQHPTAVPTLLLSPQPHTPAHTIPPPEHRNGRPHHPGHPPAPAPPPPRLGKAQPFLSVPSLPAGKCSLPGPDADYSSQQLCWQHPGAGQAHGARQPQSPHGSPRGGRAGWGCSWARPRLGRP